MNIIYTPLQKHLIKNNQRIHLKLNKSSAEWTNLLMVSLIICFGSRCQGNARVVPVSFTAIVWWCLCILMYFQSMAFREKMKVDTILEDYKQPEVPYPVFPQNNKKSSGISIFILEPMSSVNFTFSPRDPDMKYIYQSMIQKNQNRRYTYISVLTRASAFSGLSPSSW